MKAVDFPSPAMDACAVSCGTDAGFSFDILGSLGTTSLVGAPAVVSDPPAGAGA